MCSVVFFLCDARLVLLVNGRSPGMGRNLPGKAPEAEAISQYPRSHFTRACENHWFLLIRPAIEPLFSYFSGGYVRVGG